MMEKRKGCGVADNRTKNTKQKSNKKRPVCVSVCSCEPSPTRPSNFLRVTHKIIIISQKHMWQQEICKKIIIIIKNDIP